MMRSAEGPAAQRAQPSCRSPNASGFLGHDSAADLLADRALGWPHASEIDHIEANGLQPAADALIRSASHCQLGREALIRACRCR